MAPGTTQRKSSVTPERWQKVREVFDKAVESGPSEADRIARQECGADSDLYEQVGRMLAEHERSSPLDRPVWDPAAPGIFAVGQTVAGRYRIKRYLGRSGVGDEYEAPDLQLGESPSLK